MHDPIAVIMCRRYRPDPRLRSQFALPRGAERRGIRASRLESSVHSGASAAVSMTTSSADQPERHDHEREPPQARRVVLAHLDEAGFRVGALSGDVVGGGAEADGRDGRVPSQRVDEQAGSARGPSRARCSRPRQSECRCRRRPRGSQEAQACPGSLGSPCASADSRSAARRAQSAPARRHEAGSTPLRPKPLARDASAPHAAGRATRQAAARERVRTPPIPERRQTSSSRTSCATALAARTRFSRIVPLLSD